MFINGIKELDHQISLYQFYIGCYIKGLISYMVVDGALLKFALDERNFRYIFSIAALLVSITALFIINYSLFHLKKMKKTFQRLAKITETEEISTQPFQILIVSSLIFLLITIVGWFYILIQLT